MIGKLLGHNKVKTTARYVHLANDPLNAAANRITGRIAKVAGWSVDAALPGGCGGRLPPES